MDTMTAFLLTPHSDFGEILKQSLNKVTTLEVKVASSTLEAERLLGECRQLQYALLDMELGVDEVLHQGARVKVDFPEVKLVLIAKKALPPEMDQLQPWTLLKKPFGKRELFNLFQVDPETIQDETDYLDLNFHGEAGAIPVWLNDEVRAKEILVAAMSNLDAQEAMILGRESMLASSGSMLPESIEEFSNVLRNAWTECSKSEVIKPVNLRTTSGKHLLHASLLAVGLILALAYDAETPYHIVRSQSRCLLDTLKNPQLTASQVHILPERVKPASPVAQVETYSPPPTYVIRKNQLWVSAPSETKTSKEPPPGTAQPVRAETRPLPVQPRPQVKAQEPVVVAPASRTRAGSPVQSQPEAGRGKVGLQARKGSLAHYSVSTSDPGMFDVFYACVLLPRIKTQSLSGDLGSFLRAELPNLFLAYGWRLDALQIDPAHLQWLVRIPPSIAPTAHIKTVRTQTSKLILSNFHRLNRNELLHDFWAPGYLLGSGKELIPLEEVHEFIRLNRSQHYSETLPPRPSR